MTKAIIGIGIPGSGKTTVLKKFAEKNGYSYISPDEIRKELTGNAANQGMMREVWDTVHKRASEAIKRGETVVVDATFVNHLERKKFIEFLHESGAEKVQGIYADIPEEIARERNRARERVVPEHAMDRMAGQLRDFPPDLSDGLDSLFSINENGEMTEVTAEIGSSEIKRSMGKLR